MQADCGAAVRDDRLDEEARPDQLLGGAQHIEDEPADAPSRTPTIPRGLSLPAASQRYACGCPFCFCAINADPVLCRLPDGFFCAVLGACCSHGGGRLVACAAEKANPGAGKLRTEAPFAQILPRFYKREYVHFTRPLYTVLVTQEQEEEE